MKHTFLFLITVFLTLFLISCKKAKVVEPLDCRIAFKLRFTDKDTGEDFGMKNAAFLDSIKIIAYSSIKDTFLSIGLDKYIHESFENEAKYFTFSGGGFDLCNEDLYSNIGIKEKYVIKYTEDVQSDSIILWAGKISSVSTIIYSLNDSVIGTVAKADIHSGELDIHINLKK